MKKLYLLLIVGIFACFAWSCSDDDDNDITVPESELPMAAKSFISEFYPAEKVVKVKKENSNGVISYDVAFASGLDIDFDAAGQWTDVDAPKGQTLPLGIVPDQIMEYITETFPTLGVNEISRDKFGYEVELVNGRDLYFDTNFNFIP